MKPTLFLCGTSNSAQPAMSLPSGNSPLTETLSRSLQLLRLHFPMLFVANLIIFFPVLALQLGAPTLMRGRLNALPGGAAIGALLVLSLTYLLMPFSVTLVFLIIGKLDEKPIGLRKGLQAIFVRFNELFKTAILFDLIVIAGIVLGFIPGIVFMVLYALVGPIVIDEGISGGPAFYRSKELTRGSRLRILWIVLLLLFALFTFQSLMAGVSELMQVIQPVTFSQSSSSSPQYTFSYGRYVFVTVVTYLVNTFLYTYQAVCLTLIYSKVQVQRKSLDLKSALAASR